MAGKKKKKKKKPSQSGKTGKIFVGVAGEGNSICAVKIRKTKTGAELLEAKQFTLKNSLDSVEIAGDVFEDFENIEESDDSSVDISESDEELNLLGISTEDEESKDDSGVFIEILKMASDRGSKMAISLAEPQVFYNVFDSDWGLKGKKLEKRVVAELATMKEEYVSLKNDSYQLLNISGERLMAIVREPELAVIHQMENVKGYTGNRLPFITFIESSEISLVNLVLQSYDLPEEANSLILHIGPETSHFIFLQGTKLHHISPSIATGYTSENVSGTLSSRLLFELDSLDLQTVDNVFLSGYAAKTEIQSFLEDTFQGETAIQVLTVDKLDKGTFEEDLPPEKEEIDPFASTSATPPSSDMMPDYELDDPISSFDKSDAGSETESAFSTETGLSLQDELEMELGGGISAGSSIVDQDDELVNQEKVTPKKIEDELEIELGSIPYTDLPPMPDMNDEMDADSQSGQDEEEKPPVSDNVEKDVSGRVDDLISRVEEELANLPPVDDQPAYFQQDEDQVEEFVDDVETEPEKIDDGQDDDDDDDDDSGNTESIDIKPNSDSPFIIHDKSDQEERSEEYFDSEPDIKESEDTDKEIPEDSVETVDDEDPDETLESDDPENIDESEDDVITEETIETSEDGIDSDEIEIEETSDIDESETNEETELSEDEDTTVLEDEEDTDVVESDETTETDAEEDIETDSVDEAEEPSSDQDNTESDSEEEESSTTNTLEVPEEFSRADIELAIYAPALGAAMRAAGMTGADFINLDVTPIKIKEGQNRLMISTPGWIMIALIPFIGAYTYLEVEKQAKVVSDLKWQLIPLREQIGQYESVATSITSAENTLANFERSFSVIDSLVIGTDTWSTFLDRVNRISDDLAGFWFTEIASMEGGRARLSGYSIYRNRIPRFIEKLGNAQLKRVDVQEIRKKKVYRFEVEAIITKNEDE